MLGRFTMPIRKKVAAGLLATSLGVFALVAGAPSASASATGCTWAPGGIGSYQCMAVRGSGTHIDPVTETYNDPAYNTCQYQAQWLGDFTASGWTYYYSAYVYGCSFNTAWLGPYTIGNGWMVNHSHIYGYWQSDTTGHQWT